MSAVTTFPFIIASERYLQGDFFYNVLKISENFAPAAMNTDFKNLNCEVLS